jgi:hypothetical protein
MSYSKFKALRPQSVARTVPALNPAMRSFIPQISLQECTNYFAMRAMLQYDWNPL